LQATAGFSSGRPVSPVVNLADLPPWFILNSSYVPSDVHAVVPVFVPVSVSQLFQFAIGRVTQ
jgi:hypothetical protein